MSTASQPLTKPPFDLDASLWGFVTRELAPTPGRLNSAVRAAVSASVMLLIGEACHSEVLFVALFLPLLIPRDTPQQTWAATKGTIIIAWAACLASIALVFLIADLPWARVLALALAIFICMILSRGLHQPPIAAIAPVIFTLVLTRMDSVNSTSAAITMGLWLALMMSAGDLVATAVDFLYPHPGPRQLITRGIVERLHAAAAALRQSAGAQLSAEEQGLAQGQGKLALAGTGNLRKLLPALATQPSVDRHDVLRLGALLNSIDLLSEQALQLPGGDTAAFSPEQQGLADKVAQGCRALARQIERNDLAKREALEIPPGGQGHGRLLADMGDQLNDLWRFWSSDIAAAAQAADTATNAAGDSRAGKAETTTPKPGPFVTPDDVRFAVKVTLACMICYVLYNGVAWQGLSTSLLTCFFTADSTIGGTFRKLSLRITGVLVGSLLFGIVGVALILSHLDNVFEFTLYVAMVFFVSGWVAKGSPRISYAGSQIGISYGLVTLMTTTIPTEIVQPRDRLVGVLLGTVVMWFVFTRIWPQDTRAVQKQALASLIRTGSDLTLLTVDDSPANTRRAKLQTLRETVQGGITRAEDQADLSDYESKAQQGLQAALRRSLDKTRNLLMLELAEVDLTLHAAGAGPSAVPDKADAERVAEHLRFLATRVVEGRPAQPGDEQRPGRSDLDPEQDSALHPGAGSAAEAAFRIARASIQRRRSTLLKELSQSVEEVTLSASA